MENFRERYGQWALVAGGSGGMGGEHANRLAAEAMNVVVIGINDDEVRAKQQQLERDYGIETLGLAHDLGADDALEVVVAAVGDREIGAVVYNAGLADIAGFETRSVEHERYRLNLNVGNLLAFTVHFAKPMVERGRGAIVLMASAGGAVGTPFIQTYSASKAYIFTLAEGLWGEFHGTGVDVLAVLPGNTIGESFTDVPPGTPGFQTGAEVVAEAYAALGVAPTVVTGESARASVAPYFRQSERQTAIAENAAKMRALAEAYGTNN